MDISQGLTEGDYAEKAIYSVVTIAEASRMWGRSQTAFINAIMRGHVVARKSGRTWLINTHSILIHYGYPPDDSFDLGD